MQYEVSRYQNQSNEMHNQSQLHINSIYTNVDAQLREQACIIHNSSFSFGEFDAVTRSVPVTFTVEPKEVTDSMTVSLKFQDETMLLAKDDTVYSGTKTLTLYDNELYPTIVIEDSGVQSVTQDAGLRIYDLVNEFIPRLYIYSSFYGDVETTAGSDTIDYLQIGDLFIDGAYDAFENAQLVTYIDGEKANEIAIDLDECSAGNPVFPPEETYQLTEGQILTTSVIALDTMGLHHEYPLEYYKAGSDIQREPYYDAIRITASNGQVVYESGY